MPEKPRRRWFRFSLRTIFVAVTVLCCWLGWQLSVVRQRQTALKELRESPGFHITSAESWVARYPPGRPVPSAATVPLWREWMGDQAIQEIWYTPHIQAPSETQLSRLARTFPEAEFHEAHAEPCHPGCFPRGTLVHTPTGPVPIESVQPGYFITAINSNRELWAAKVQAVFVTDNRLWRVDTEAGALFTTQTQPLCVAADSDEAAFDRTVPAGELQPADRVLRYQDGNLLAVKVRRVSRTDRTEKVFNLILGDSDVFIAGGFLARSKPPAEVAVR